MECFKKNTFNASENIAEVTVNGEDLDLENLSPHLYDLWFSKFYVLNHSFVHENDSFNIKFNNGDQFEYFIRKTVYSIFSSLKKSEYLLKMYYFH